MHNAINVLAARDNGDALPLLRSLIQNEAPAIQARAAEAAGVLQQRTLSALRAEAYQASPDTNAIRTQVAAFAGNARDAQANELALVAYATLVTLDVEWGSDAIGSLTPDESARMVERAEGLELSGRPLEALPLLVDAALSGDARASHGLMARGIDLDRLMLGLSSELAPDHGLPRLHGIPLVQTADPLAVQVLLTRAETGHSVPRLAALENLGVLLQDGTLNDPQQQRVRAALLQASHDFRPAVRVTARNALLLPP